MGPNVPDSSNDREPRENDSCLENNDASTKHPRKKWGLLGAAGLTVKWLLVLAILVFIVLVLFIVVIVLATRYCGPEPVPAQKVCNGPECLRASATILESVNTSADPCQDFWEYACGGWVAHHEPPPAQYGWVSVRDRLARQYLARTRELIETHPHVDDFRSIPWKVKAFYQSCMDLDAVDNSKEVALIRVIDSLRGWKVINTWSENSWEWPKVLRDLHVQYGVFPFFQIGFEPDDPTTSNQNMIQILPSGLGLPHRSYYFRNPEDKVVKGYKQLMQELAQHLGATAQQARGFVDEVFHFEKRIAEVTPAPEEWNLHGKKEVITIKELRQISQRVDWIEYLTALLPQTPINDNAPVVTPSKHYLMAVSTILSTTDKGPLNNYLIWTVILKYAPYLSQEFRDTFDIYRKVLTGATRSLERWEFCMEETNKIFNVALLSMYIRKHIAQNEFKSAKNVYNRVKDAVTERLGEVEWMDESTKRIAIDKIRYVDGHIAYDDFVLSGNFLSDYYEKMTVSKMDFFNNVRNSVFFRRQQLEAFLRDASIRQWELKDFMSLQPYFVSHLSEIIVHPLLLQSPIFQANFPLSLQYGALGAMLGHEVVHAFDEVGKIFDQKGFSPLTWSNVTTAVFHKNRECIAKHYRSLDYNNVTDIIANRSLENDIADIGGVIHALRAFKKVSQHHDEPLQPGMDLSHDKLYFIAFAQALCSTSSASHFENSLHLDHVSPSKLRVMGALSQVPQFAEVFQCHLGSVMNPRKKCLLW